MSQNTPVGGETMKIRRARADEASRVADVWLRSRKASIPAIPPPVHSDEEVRDWFDAVVLATMKVWVATMDGTIVAVMVLHREWIEHLYVDPDHAGRGIGTELIDLAKQRSSGVLTLWTFAANTGARRFYERHAFEAVQATDGDNEEGAPDVRYEWRRSTRLE